MGFLASIFAYVSAIAAIIVFFLMSADALLYHPRHHATTRSELVTAAKIGPYNPGKAAQPPQRSANNAAIPQRGTVAEYRRKAAVSNNRFEEQHRRALRREQQARYWAPRREHAAAPRALGYAEEPALPFGDEPWR